MPSRHFPVRGRTGEGLYSALGVDTAKLKKTIASEITRGIATAMPYVVIGAVFAYSYAKTNNLAVNILFHLLYNSLAVLASMLK